MGQNSAILNNRDVDAMYCSKQDPLPELVGAAVRLDGYRVSDLFLFAHGSFIFPGCYIENTRV